jgi:hypothetical protein
MVSASKPRQGPQKPVPRFPSRRSTQTISRQCNGLYNGDHGCHAWFTVNPATGRSYRRGGVVWFCSGTYALPNGPSILPEAGPENLESSVRGHRG